MAGLAGKTSEEAMRIDEAICLVSGFIDDMVRSLFEKDAAKKVHLMGNKKKSVALKSAFMVGTFF